MTRDRLARLAASMGRYRALIPCGHVTACDKANSIYCNPTLTRLARVEFPQSSVAE